MGPFAPRQNKITVFDVASWSTADPWWLDGSIVDRCFFRDFTSPQKEGLCGTHMSSGYYFPYDSRRFHSQSLWGMQRACHSNVTSEPATAESLHCWRRCWVLVCDFKVSWPPESTISDAENARKFMMLIAWSRWAFIEKNMVMASFREAFIRP